MFICQSDTMCGVMKCHKCICGPLLGELMMLLKTLIFSIHLENYALQKWRKNEVVVWAGNDYFGPVPNGKWDEEGWEPL